MNAEGGWVGTPSPSPWQVCMPTCVWQVCSTSVYDKCKCVGEAHSEAHSGERRGERRGVIWRKKRGGRHTTQVLRAQVSLDELEGIESFEKFFLSGGREYVKETDKGVGMSFWDGLRDEQKCAERVRRAESLFAAL